MSLRDILVFFLGMIILFFGVVSFFGAPYVPSRKKDLEHAFNKLYRLKPTDVLVDLGSGDGKVIKLASQSGASAIGYELNPILLLISMLNLRHYRNARIQWKNCWTKVPKQTTIIYAFVVSRDVPKLEQTIKKSLIGRNKPLYVMTYGSGLRNKFTKPVDKYGAHNLYRLDPLQNDLK